MSVETDKIGSGWENRLVLAMLLCIGQMLYQKIGLDTGNLTLYIPLIRFLEGKANFINDPIYSGLRYYASYFYTLIAYLHLSDSMLRLFFAAGYFIFETVIFYVLFLLWEYFKFSDRIIIWSGVLLALGYLPAVGAAAWWWIFTHQMPALLMILAAFYLLLKDKPLISAILLGIAANIHIIFAFSASIFFGLYLIYNKKWKYFLWGILLIAVFSIPTVLKVLTLNTTTNDDTVLKLLYTRSQTELFPSRLGVLWIPFVVFAIIVLMQANSLWREIKYWAVPLVASTVISILIAVAGDITKNLFLLRTQSLRGSLYFVLLFLPFLTQYIFSTAEKTRASLLSFIPVWGRYPPVSHISLIFPSIVQSKKTLWIIGTIWTTALVIGPILVWSGLVPYENVKNFVITDYELWARYVPIGIIMTIGIWADFWKKYKMFPVYVLLLFALLRAAVGGPFSVQDKYWVDVQKWAAQNTSPNATFLVPPTSDGFRVYSRRSIVFDWKSGPGVDTKWWERLQLFHPAEYSPEGVRQAYEKMSDLEKVKIAQSVGAEYIVCSAKKNFSLGKRVYSNLKWSVYKIGVDNEKTNLDNFGDNPHSAGGSWGSDKKSRKREAR